MDTIYLDPIETVTVTRSRLLPVWLVAVLAIGAVVLVVRTVR